MNVVESYLDRVCSSLGGSSSLRRHIREELEEHLLEAIERYTTQGLPREEATARVIKEFGTAEIVGKELEAVHGRRPVMVMMEKAMAWKEKTLKTGRLWNLVAHIALGLVLAVEALFVCSAAVYIFPKLESSYMNLGEPLPEYPRWVMDLNSSLLSNWFVWLPLVVIAWGLFEWRYRGENKSGVRLAAGGVASLGMMAIVFTVTVAMVVPFALLPGMIQMQRAETVVLEKTLQAETSFNQLSRAIDREDWPAATKSGQELRNALEFLARTGSAVPALAVLNRQEELDEIRDLLTRVSEISNKVYSSSHKKDREELKKHYSDLEEAYGLLAGKVEGWPRRE